MCDTTSDDYRRLGAILVFGYPKEISNEEMVENFGVTPLVAVLQWRLMRPHLSSEARPIHHLWTLYHAKRYPSEVVFQTITRTHAQTLRKWMAPIRKAFEAVLPKIVSQWKCTLFVFAAIVELTPQFLLSGPMGRSFAM